MSRKKRGRRCIALAIGCTAFVVLAEATLWALHFAFAPPAREELLAPRAGERRILCIGDSNTYGVHLEPCASYPGRLQRYLDRAAGQPWRTLNLGYPSQNTAQMRARLAENLAAYRPEIVILWGGVNNTWSPAMRHMWEHPDSEPGPPAGELLLQQVRVYKFARMLASRFRKAGALASVLPAAETTEGQGAVPGLDGAERGEGLGSIDSKLPSEAVIYGDDHVARTIALDLGRVLAICKEHGARLVLADYPWETRVVDESVDPAIARFANDNHVPLVALKASIRPVVERLGARCTLFADLHATALLNREVARQVLLALIDAGLLERREEWLTVPPLSTYAGRVLFERIADDTLGARFEIQGEPHWMYVIRAEALEAPLASGRLDGHGWALARVDFRAAPAELRSARMWAEIRLPSEPNAPRLSEQLALDDTQFELDAGR